MRIRGCRRHRWFWTLGLVLPALAAPAVTQADARPFGFQLRLRQEYYDNAIDLNDATDDRASYLRVRSALWGRYAILENAEVYARLNNEFRRYFHPDVDFEIDEVIFENLYLKLTKVGGLPLDLTLGRQNIQFGEGFLILDGGPLDGSRTSYQNAVRATWKTSREAIDLVAISNPRTDEYLPIVNDQDRSLVESRERLAGLHVSSTRLGRMELQPYYFYKEEDARGGRGALELHTVGARVAVTPSGSDRIVLESAWQTGQRGGADVSALGIHGYVDVGVGSRGDRFRTGWFHLSGPEGHSAEGWNPLLSRWPKWSELYIYTLVREGGVAYWTNVSSLFLTTTHPAGAHASLRMSVYGFLSPTRRPSSLNSFRGACVQSEFQVRFNQKVSGHLLAETFLPGDYYAEDVGYPVSKSPAGPSRTLSHSASPWGQDPAVFLRWQLLIDL